MTVGHTGGMAGNPLRAYFKWQQRENEQMRQANADYKRNRVREIEQVSDAELIATTPGLTDESHSMEMSRRLKVAVENLTGEVITSRESADRLARRVVWLTAIIVVLTATLVALTIVLALKK